MACTSFGESLDGLRRRLEDVWERRELSIYLFIYVVKPSYETVQQKNIRLYKRRRASRGWRSNWPYSIHKGGSREAGSPIFPDA